MRGLRSTIALLVVLIGLAPTSTSSLRSTPESGRRAAQERVFAALERRHDRRDSRSSRKRAKRRALKKDERDVADDGAARR